ncbi:hypothetical protein NC651_008920 [Populus alba x Populus x berolinensis]|nr:hypothetical protein NC651_008920 [Populus alba x Populus x berolinensis]
MHLKGPITHKLISGVPVYVTNSVFNSLAGANNLFACSWIDCVVRKGIRPPIPSYSESSKLDPNSHIIEPLYAINY